MVKRMNLLLRCLAVTGLLTSAVASDYEPLDPDYGAVLFQFYQADYFQSLIEFRLAREHGGIEGQGEWPTLVEGGVRLSYGMERDARAIFSERLDNLANEPTRNRAWLYIARIHYERGDYEQAWVNWSRLVQPVQNDLAGEALYLGTLIALKQGEYEQLFTMLEGGVERDRYEPFTWFNAGLASVRQQRYVQAQRYFENTIASSRRDPQNRWALEDRSHMALAHVHVQSGRLDAAEREIGQVREHGPFSRLAILAQAWVADLRGDSATAFTVAREVSQGSVAYPETQEALLLRAGLLEKLQRPGRAVAAFDQAVKRYQRGYAQIDELRSTLVSSDLLGVLVSDLQQTVGETDWFGEPPVLESAALTPYLYQLMSTNEFQALLKDLRDLYAIRLNLTHWSQRRADYDTMVQAQQRHVEGQNIAERTSAVRTELEQQARRLQRLRARADQLAEPAREQAEKTLAQLDNKLDESRALSLGVRDRTDNAVDIAQYQARVDRTFTRLEAARARVDATVQELERIILLTINADLDRQQNHIRLYEVQARLARARLLDAALVNRHTVVREPGNPAGVTP